MKTTKSRIIFFAIAITYNLLLGLHLKDFLVLQNIKIIRTLIRFGLSLLGTLKGPRLHFALAGVRQKSR